MSDCPFLFEARKGKERERSPHLSPIIRLLFYPQDRSFSSWKQQTLAGSGEKGKVQEKLFQKHLSTVSLLPSAGSFRSLLSPPPSFGASNQGGGGGSHFKLPLRCKYDLSPYEITAEPPPPLSPSFLGTTTHTQSFVSASNFDDYHRSG